LPARAGLGCTFAGSLTSSQTYLLQISLRTLGGVGFHL